MYATHHGTGMRQSLGTDVLILLSFSSQLSLMSGEETKHVKVKKRVVKNCRQVYLIVWRKEGFIQGCSPLRDAEMQLGLGKGPTASKEAPSTCQSMCQWWLKIHPQGNPMAHLRISWRKDEMGKKGWSHRPIFGMRVVFLPLSNEYCLDKWMGRR